LLPPRPSHSFPTRRSSDLFAVFSNWTHPLLTLGLFVVLELLTAYFIEPWLYGHHTGVSSLAILVAAAFWAAIWGPVGLILSTPLDRKSTRLNSSHRTISYA